ncbi:MAG: hypothetical protein HOV86_33385 [Thermoactinospora sp.]|nr:hypothetical protein [Thermoactinospora sp.]
MSDVKALDRLVGTWKVTGGAEGTVTYRWMAGGHFLLQDVELNGESGLEIIGHDKPFGSETPDPEIKSRYYGSSGSTLAYVYEIDGDELTIWGGFKDSGARYRGTFSADGDTLTGAWEYPGGGGYESVATRVR